MVSISSCEKLRTEKRYNKENSLRPIPPRVIGSSVIIQTMGINDKNGNIDILSISIDIAV
tara:strand:+ start:1041 stop:1220 length:180 start_codon:yes stop_codon:yes gene_type:complete